MSSRFFFFTLFSLLCCTFLSLVAGRSANVTIDDSGVDPVSDETLVYSSGWHTASDCKHCPSSVRSTAFNKTWHAVPPSKNSEQDNQTVLFNFDGSALYVFGILEPSSSTAELSFFIDGQPVGTYKVPSVQGNQYVYNHTLYANSSIVDGQHTFIMQQSVSGGNSPPVFLDFLQYSSDDGDEEEDNSDGHGHGGHGNGGGGGGSGGGGSSHSSGSHSSQTIIIACAVALTVVLVVVLLLLLYTCRRRIFRRRTRTTTEKKEKFVELEDRSDTESLPGMEPYTYLVQSGPPPLPEKGRTLRIVNSPPSLSTSSQTISPTQHSPDVLSTPPAPQPRPMRSIPGARVVYPWRRQPPNTELPPSYEVSTFVV